jgi:hypothetical protein
LSNPERATLAEIGRRLGRKMLAEVACVAKPDTILAWYRKLVAEKFDGSKHRQYPGRPTVPRNSENASPFGTFKVYLSWAAMASATRTDRNTPTNTISPILLRFMPDLLC